MPYTLNGFGTHYYGRKNQRSRVATCARCGKESRLGAFDTWYCVCVLYLPILPLGRRHVVDYCFHCTAHTAVKPADWERLRLGALEEAMRKVAESPADAGAQIALHQACLFFAEREKADALRLRLEEQFPRDPRVLVYLAAVLGEDGRAAEAQAMLERAREIDPASVPAPPPPLPRKRISFVPLYILLTLFVAGFSIASLVKSRMRTLHVVSGFDEPVTIEIEGEPPLTLPPHERSTRTLAEGRHRARIRGAIQTEHEFEIESSFFLRLFDSRTFVLNPGSEAVLLFQTATYAVQGGGPTQNQFLYGEPFYRLSKVDYEFVPFPHQIELESASPEKKTRLDYFRGGPEDAFRALVNLSRHDDACALAERVLRSRPRPRSRLAEEYGRLAEIHGLHPRALPVLRELCARRPVDVPVHRAYQDLTLAPGPSLTLGSEYDALLAAAPEDSALLYLRGRLAPRVSQSRPYHERAIRSDPGNAWAHGALAHGFASVGDWESARAGAEKACALQPRTESFRTLLCLARLALRDTDALAQELTAESYRNFLSLPLHELLVQVLAAAGRADDARAAGREYLDRLRGRREADAPEASLRFQSTLLYALGDFEALARAQAGPDSLKAARFELGRLEEIEKEEKQPDAYTLALLSMAKKGDAGAFDRAAAALEQGPPQFRSFGRAIRSGSLEDLKAALDEDLDPHWKAPLVALAARRFPDRAADLRALARRLNVLPAFPYHLVRRAAEEK